MHSICLKRSSASERLKKSSMMTALITSTVLKPVLIASFIGLNIAGMQAQAAIDDESSPTASLQLISLNADELSVENDADDLSDIADMLDAADASDDAIDSVADESALTDEADDINTDIPAEVEQVSLNAISPETLKTFVAVVDLVRREYVDTVNDEELFNNAMSGMLTKLDSHAEFLDAEAYENLRAFTEGDVGDVGIKVMYRPKAG